MFELVVNKVKIQMVDNKKVSLRHFKMSQPSRAVRSLLMMTGQDFEDLALSPPQHRSEEFDKLSGGHLHCPLLVHGDFAVTESASALRYIARAFSKHLPAGIYPEDIKSQINVDRWLDWSISSFRPGMGSVMMVVFTHPKDDTFKPAFDAAIAKQSAALDNLEKFLGRVGTPFIAGDKLTIADVHIFQEATTEFYVDNPTTLENDTKRPLTQAWRARVLENAVIKEINDELMNQTMIFVHKLTGAGKQ